MNKRTVGDCGDVPKSKYRIVLDGSVIVTSTNRWFRTAQHTVAIYEQTKRRSISTPKKL